MPLGRRKRSLKDTIDDAATTPELTDVVQLYKSRVVIALLALTCLIVGLYWTGSVVASLPSVLHWVPWDALAAASLAALLVAFVYEFFARRESERRLALTLRAEVARNQPILLSELRRSLLIDPSLMTRVLNPIELDGVLRTALQVRAHDAKLADGLYTTILVPALKATCFRSNYYHKFVLAPYRPASSLARPELYFHVHQHVSYETILTDPTQRFAVFGSAAAFYIHRHDTTNEFQWLLPSMLSQTEPELLDVFELTNVRVDEIEMSISSSYEADRWVIEARNDDVARLIGKPVRVEYKFKTRVKRRGHSLFLRLDRPTHNAAIEIDFGLVPIAHMNAYDFFVTPTPPRIDLLPVDAPVTVRVALNDWVLAKSGVVFCWVLAEEMTDAFKGLLAAGGRGVERQLP
jgi:hypothetical protein